MPINTGLFRTKVEIWEWVLTDKRNALKEKIREKKKVKTVFARLESRVGSLLAGRAADTIVEKTTMKITYFYKNYPGLKPEKNFLKVNGQTFKIKYALDETCKRELMQVFCSEEI